MPLAMPISEHSIIPMARLKTKLFAVAVAILGLCGGCGGDDEKKNAPAPKSASQATTVAAEAATTAPETAEGGSVVSAGQLDFFTERYISTEERLQRRQTRLEQQLSGGANPGAN